MYAMVIDTRAELRELLRTSSDSSRGSASPSVSSRLFRGGREAVMRRVEMGAQGGGAVACGE
eukprot:2799123-Heterocapsa_arctica.AAC.1